MAINKRHAWVTLVAVLACTVGFTLGSGTSNKSIGKPFLELLSTFPGEALVTPSYWFRPLAGKDRLSMTNATLLVFDAKTGSRIKVKTNQGLVASVEGWGESVDESISIRAGLALDEVLDMKESEVRMFFQDLTVSEYARTTKSRHFTGSVRINRPELPWEIFTGYLVTTFYFVDGYCVGVVHSRSDI